MSSPQPRQYIHNTAWTLIEKVSRIISGLLVGVLVARYLGPSQFGIISYALNVVAIFTFLSILGLDSIIVRELVKRPQDNNEIIGSAFFMRLLGALCVVAAATAYSALRDEPAVTWIVFLVSIAIVFQSLTVIDFFFQSKVMGRFPAIAQIITLTISGIVKLLMILLEAPLEAFACMVMAEALLAGICQLTFYTRQQLNISSWRFSSSEAKHLLRQSWPILISGMILVLYQKMDQVLIKRFLDLYQLGNYAAAVRISEASWFIPVAISAAVFPGFVKAAHDRAHSDRRLTQLYSLLLWIAIPAALVVTLLSDFITSLLYGEKFPLAGEVLQIHIWSIIPVFFTTAWGMWMIGEGKQKFIIIFQLISLAVCVTLALTLIPHFGIRGAAWAIVGTYHAGMIAALLCHQPARSLQLFISALNPRHLADVYRYYKK